MLSEQEPIIVQFFGTFSIRQGDTVLSETDNRSKKLWKILQYILANRRRPISPEELMSLIWSEEEQESRSPSALKTLMHRLRTFLEQLGIEESHHMILRQNGNFVWNPHLPMKVDAEEFQEAIERTKKISLPDEKLNYLLRAMAIYQGPYLGDKYADEAWASAPAETYRRQYFACYNGAVEILAGDERYDEVIFLSRHAAEFDPDRETYYYNEISSLVALGREQEALSAYERVLDLFYTVYRKTPSPHLRALYRGLTRTEHGVEADLSVIKEDLEDGRVRGPIRCEYDTFRLLYEQKCLAGLGNEYLILLSVVPISGKGELPTGKTVDRALGQIERQLCRGLNEGDIYTRYSVTQFLMIIAATDEESLLSRARKELRSFRNSLAAIQLRVDCKAQRIGEGEPE